MPLIGVPWPQSHSKNYFFLFFKLTYIHQFHYNFLYVKAYCLENNIKAKYVSTFVLPNSINQ